MDETLRDFGIAVGKLKRAFAKEYNWNFNYIEIHIDSDNNVTITPTNYFGYSEAYRDWVSTEE